MTLLEQHSDVTGNVSNEATTDGTGIGFEVMTGVGSVARETQIYVLKLMQH